MTDWKTMDFAAFQTFRLQLLGNGFSGIDAGNTDLYNTLRRGDGERFPTIVPTAQPQGAYRCHLAEAFLDHLGLDAEHFRGRCLVSRGVRHSLSLLLQQTSTKAWCLPNDVYPVYCELANEAGVRTRTYSARDGMPWEFMKTQRHWMVLVCDPVKPWGGRLDGSQWSDVMKLAREQQGCLVVDAAYDLSLGEPVRAALANDSPIAFLGSLSKGWLLPYRGGIVLTQRELAGQWRARFQRATKDERACREAFAALTEHRDYPRRVADAVATAQDRLTNAMVERGVSLVRSHGYWATTDHEAPALLARGILAIPPSVFGETHVGAGAVLSAIGLMAGTS